MKKRLYCPVCGKELTDAEYRKALGIKHTASRPSLRRTHTRGRATASAARAK